MAENIIQFRHVHKGFESEDVISDLNLDIPGKGIFVLVGPSGSGKTTTLKMINRLQDVDGGVITFMGKDIKRYDLRKLRWQIGYVLQQIALFPNLTVRQNINLIPEMQHMDAAEKRERGDRLLNAVGLPPESYNQRYPRELSGGEAQRVGIVRAFIAGAQTILMDEPFSALDPLSRRQLQDLVLSLQEKLQKTIVFVTHDMQEALKLGDQIAVMHNGRIEQQGKPEDILTHPASQFVASFFVGAHETSPQNTLGELIAAGCAQAVPATKDYVPAKTQLSMVLPELSRGERVTFRLEDAYYEIDAARVLHFLFPDSVE